MFVIGCLVACVASGRPRTTASQDPPAANPSTLAPGMTTTRRFGPATFRVEIDEDMVMVHVELVLDDRKMAAETLRPGHTAARFDLVSGASRVRGSLAARFAAAGAPSTLAGDFVAADATGEFPFRGDLAAWTWPDGVVWARHTTWLTPELSATAAVLADGNQSVRVRFTGAGQPLTSVTLQIGAEDVVVTRAFRVGSVEIRSGMHLHMQPATPSQEGVALLDGSFASSNLPDVQFAGAILTWSQAPVETAPESTP